MNVIKVFLLTAILVLFIACSSESSATPVPTPDVEKAVATAVAKALATAESSEVSKPEEIQIQDLIKGLRKGTVSRVIDGDTIELSSGEKIRYLEVSTPEMSPLECYAQEATQKNSELVLGKTIYIQPPTEGNKTSYNRTLAYVFTDEYFVFLELVKSGYAIVELYAAPNEFYDLLKKAEDDAQLNNRGLWGKCNSLTPKPTPIPTPTPNPADIAETNRIEGKKKYDAGDDSGAIENYTKAIQNDPIYDDYYWRGRAYLNLGLSEKALNDFNRVYSPNNPKQGYGSLHKDAGKLREYIISSKTRGN
tara:strand:+ start:360 stop:1277 length:918 start_codon:yes stop_codon:yes gene_type:complete